MRVITLIAKLSMVLALSACTWVKVSSEGAGVSVKTAAQAQGCERLGQTHTQTQDKIGFIGRSQRKQREELEGLAKNEAAIMGGNAVVAEGDIVDGRQTFIIYKCQ